jgi:hypothetical protein
MPARLMLVSWVMIWGIFLWRRTPLRSMKQTVP